MDLRHQNDFQAELSKALENKDICRLLAIAIVPHLRNAKDFLGIDPVDYSAKLHTSELPRHNE